ncbi:MAG: HAMP domain-containing histidine kinase [Bacteroidales bacterium]|nr:HAMP domain-containing histidine kinase [Bacteroidales bacterium]
MNIYTKKVRWKFFLLLGAVFIGVGSLLYTNILIDKLEKEERKKVELWAKATSLIINSDVKDESLEFLLNVIENNETVPVIVVDNDTNILQYRNLDTARVSNPVYLKRKLYEMMEQTTPIEIPIVRNEKQYLYYSRSTILSKLTYYPFIQLGVILLFILVAYFAFSSSRKAEQNQVWVGLSKETAHQLGTPISSLMAWNEMLKINKDDPSLLLELEKDIKRLNKITERFSKIGSQPNLKSDNLINIINNAIQYLKTRSSDRIHFSFKSVLKEVLVPINASLFEWVVENVCKNAMDAIEGEGNINILISEDAHHVQIDITDDGKGIPKTKQKTIFKPGFTTKERGWGLGLSLTKRIIEEYHKGRIFVADSELGKGTTFRIILKK